MEKVGASLAQSAATLTQSLNKQAGKMSEVVENMNAEVAARSQELAKQDLAGTVVPDAAEVEMQEITLSDQTMEAQQRQLGLEESLVQMQEAKLAYKASAKALEVVNDVEREGVDILK